MMASGELPDVLLGSGATNTSDFAQFSYLFADMNELLDYAPNVVKMFEEKPEIKAMVTSEDGAIYGLSKYQRYWPKNMCMQMINSEWLERLNLDVPTTWTSSMMYWLHFAIRMPMAMVIPTTRFLWTGLLA